MFKLTGKPIIYQPKPLRLIVGGPSGSGKSTVAIDRDKGYIISTEEGIDHLHYCKIIEKNDSAICYTTSWESVVSEVKALLEEKHEYKTLVIDSISMVWQSLLTDCFSRAKRNYMLQYQLANKEANRLIKLLLMLPMHVILIAHEKDVYEKNDLGEDIKIGTTYDFYKKATYSMDLVIMTTKSRQLNTKSTARIVKTRLKEFGENETFTWCKEELLKYIGNAASITKIDRRIFISNESINKINQLYIDCHIGQINQDNILHKNGVENIEDLSQEQGNKLIENLLKYHNKNTENKQ